MRASVDHASSAMTAREGPIAEERILREGSIPGLEPGVRAHEGASEGITSPGAEALVLEPGLPIGDVKERLALGLRLRDSGSRLLAFYLVEMEERRLYQDSGHSGTSHYAECRLGLERRRSRELIAVGRRLLELPAMDEAFCKGEITWSQVLLLTRVVSPEHEAEWLERARESSCRELALEVKLAKPGGRPRAPEDRKGLAEIRFPVATQLSVLAFQKWELAKKQLSEERGAPISDSECMEILASLFLSTEEDGSLPGRKRVSTSLYNVVVHREERAAGDSEKTWIESEEGPMPLDAATAEAICCDAETLEERTDKDQDADSQAQPSGAPLQHLTRDSKTSAALRARVLIRDGHQCRSCRSRYELMVHHICPRSEGGRTRPENLITLCMRCHGLVHAGLLELGGADQEADQKIDQARVNFVDRKGRTIAALGKLSSSRAMEISPPGFAALERRCADEEGRTRGGLARPRGRFIETAEDLPENIDRAWWLKNEHLFEWTAAGHCRVKPGFAVESPRATYRAGSGDRAGGLVPYGWA